MTSNHQGHQSIMEMPNHHQHQCYEHLGAVAGVVVCRLCRLEVNKPLANPRRSIQRRHHSRHHDIMMMMMLLFTFYVSRFGHQLKLSYLRI